MNFLDEDEMMELAGEYVLGLLQQEEMRDVEREMARNQRLAGAVGYWRDKLLEIAPPADPVAPSAATWRRISRTIRPPARPAGAFGWWNNLYFWRAGGIAGLLATALLSLYLVVGGQGRDAEKYLAVLQPPASGAAWLVEVDERVVRLRPLAPIALPPGKSVQFWTKPEGAAGPTSLGLVAPDRTTVVPAEKLPGMEVEQLFEVTLEPEAGSPTGRPTGPILAVGKAIRL